MSNPWRGFHFLGAQQNREEQPTEEDSEDEDASLKNDDTESSDDSVEDHISGENSGHHKVKILGKDGRTMWATSGGNTISESPPRCPSTCGAARSCDSPVSFFELFFSPDIVSKIVVHTNDEIASRRMAASINQRYHYETDETEVKSLIGIFLLSGAVKNSDAELDELYCRKFALPFYRCALPQQRLIFLLSCLRFDSKKSRFERKNMDKFAQFREIWDIFSSNCEKHYSPSSELTVGEMFLGFGGRCPFKIRMPDNADKYGLKILSLCDARSYYFCRGIPYVGQNTSSTSCVVELCKNFKNTGRNLTAGERFTSCELAEELLRHKFTYVGAVRKNKRKMPSDSTTQKSPRFLYQDDKMLTSFVDKKRKVTILSTTHHSGTINPESGKPDIVEFYDSTKDGVACMDRMCQAYTTNRRPCRWPMRYLYAILDISGVNGYILSVLAGKQFSRADFLKSIAFSLAEPQMRRRHTNLRIHKTLRREIATVVGIDESSAPTVDQQPLLKKMRCHLCGRKKDMKTVNRCDKCNIPICKQHEKLIRWCTACDESDVACNGGSEED